MYVERGRNAPGVGALWRAAPPPARIKQEPTWYGRRKRVSENAHENSDMARDQGDLRPRPPRAAPNDAGAPSRRLAGAARCRDARAVRARPPGAVRTRRRAFLRRSERSRGRRLADVAWRLAAARDRHCGRGAFGGAAAAG